MPREGEALDVAVTLTDTRPTFLDFVDRAAPCAGRGTGRYDRRLAAIDPQVNCYPASACQDCRRNVANDCPEQQPGAADFDRNRTLARARHGDTAELRTVSHPGHARSRSDGGRFHTGSRRPEYRLGPI